MPNPLEPKVMRPTRCRLCKQKLDDGLHKAILVAMDPQTKARAIEKILKPIMTHLAERHGDALKDAQLQAGEYAGMLTLMYIDCDEPLIEEQRDMTRWTVHQRTRRAVVTDERIEERLKLAFVNAVLQEVGQPEVTRLEDGPSEARMQAEVWIETKVGLSIAQTMRNMRDVLEERGRYPIPENATPKPATKTPA